jgi:hypothetical protein
MSAPFRIVKFWTKYVQRNGATVAVDMVEYCAPGMAQRASTTAPVSMLAKVQPNIDPDNIAGQMALNRWRVIEPAYNAWKQGQELPASGTPLAAWPGITPEQADVFRQTGLRSVEEIADASDSLMQRVQLPGVRDIRDNARRFLEARDQAKVADALAAKDEQINALQDQLEELRQLVLAREADSSDDLEADGSAAPRRRGRPPKVAEQSAA